MSASPLLSATLGTLPAAQAALLVAAPLVLAASAAGAGSARGWAIARAGSAAALVLAVASLAAGAVLGDGQAFGLRADAPGAIVALLIAFIGWVIVRYSEPYLDGERRQAGYRRALLATLAAAMVVALGNHLLLMALAWLAASATLQRLLVFFGDRPAARLAAHKKLIANRVADVFMLGACALLYGTFGTLQLDAMQAQASAAALPVAGQIAMLLIAAASVLKCALLPFHGWLIQVMEAPTPVSALLHAGVVNLGGFVLIRLAPLLGEAPTAAGLLVAVGTFTAVVAALVMTTRISIKVSLAWSTCAQMGFMLMQCGLGLASMALLHLVAHSLYKAHAFLSAGGAVRQTMLARLAPVAAPPSAGGLAMAGLLGIVATLAAGLLFGLQDGAAPALWVMGGIVALAVTPLLRPAHEGHLLRSAAMAFALACVYFALHALMEGVLLPSAAPQADGVMAWIAPGFVALAFALLYALQCAIAARPAGALATRLHPWFYGGLFLDERASRLVLRWFPPRRPTPHRSEEIAA